MDLEVQGLDTKALHDSERSLQTADHLLYFVYPMLKDPKLIKQALEELFSSSKNLFASILLFEHQKSKIKLHQETNENIETFKKVSQKLDLSSTELSALLEIINYYEKHKKSPTEFVRNNQIVILIDNVRYETITFEKLKSYLNVIKTAIQKFKFYKTQKF